MYTTTTRLFNVDIEAPNSDKFTLEGRKYVALDDRSRYSIIISNKHATRCDVELKTGLLESDIWALPPRSSITINRLQASKGQFLFVDEDIPTSRSRSRSTGSTANNGLISVTFSPAKKGASGVNIPDDVELLKLSEIDMSLYTEIIIQLVVRDNENTIHEKAKLLITPPRAVVMNTQPRLD